MFELTHHDGRKRVVDEVAIQIWEGDKTARERFFYDSAARRESSYQLFAPATCRVATLSRFHTLVTAIAMTKPATARSS